MSDDAEGAQKVLYICISLGLVVMGGLMSGLTLGLMSLDSVDLEVSDVQYSLVKVRNHLHLTMERDQFHRRSYCGPALPKKRDMQPELHQ